MNAMTDRLIAELKAEFGDDEKRITHALRVLERAEEILAQEEGNPGIVVAAALLHDIGIPNAQLKHGSSSPRYQEFEGPPVARRILEQLGFDQADIEQVCAIVASHHSGGMDTPEFRIIWDADNLVNLAEDQNHLSEQRTQRTVESVFKTATGRKLAGQWLLLQPPA